MTAMRERMSRWSRKRTRTSIRVLIVSGLMYSSAGIAQVSPVRVDGPMAHPVRNGIGVWAVRRLGYDVSEYLVSGRANVYAPVSMADALNMSSRNNVRDLEKHGAYRPKLLSGDVPYTTRIVVYRPRDPKRFSGNVIFEITHPAEGGRLIVWRMLNGFFIKHGDAFVEIQHPLTFSSLRSADPARYGALHSADPTQLWGMVAQVGALIRGQGASSPLRGYHIRSLYLTGYSYTGVAAATFADYYHDQARLENGAPIFSGYLPFANAMYVKPLDVPVIRVNTQSDFNSFDGTRNRREDSDGKSGRYRLYEVAGASHVNEAPVIQPSARPPRYVKLKQAAGLPDFSVRKCVEAFPHGNRPNDVPLNYVLEQAFLDMYRWVDDGVPPPRVAFIATNASGGARLDGNGNVLGGLRLPALAVPAATYGVGHGRCFLFGYRVPFSAKKMRRLYGTPQAYVRTVARAARADARMHLITSSAALLIIREAKDAARF